MTGIFRNKVVIVIVGLLVAGGVWYGLSSSSSGAAPTSAIVTNTAQTSQDKALIETLLTLRTVTLDGTIFQEPSFASLHDYGTQIVSEPSGRPNPFAPIAGMSAGSDTGTPAAPAAATTTTPAPKKGAKNIPIPQARGL
jgi:hypothetical protein